MNKDEYNAHSNGADALWAGAPLITFPGDKLCSRVAASMLKSVGLDQLIVETASVTFLFLSTNKTKIFIIIIFIDHSEEFESLAISLGRDKPCLLYTSPSPRD